MAFSTHDIVPDSPTNNFATLNPLSQSGSVISEGNLNSVIASDGYSLGTIGVNSKKWYFEYIVKDNADNNNLYLGVATSSLIKSYYRTDQGTIVISDSEVSTGLTAASTNDIISVFLDLDNNQISFYLNNTQLGSTQSLPNDTYFPLQQNANSSDPKAGYFNFGQDPTFGGASNLPTGAGDYDTDAAGNSTGGRFAFQPPTGAKALCTANLPEMTPTVYDDVPQDYFKTVLYTGNGGTQSITGVGFQPDLVWLKGRSYAEHHHLYDVVRGATKVLYSNRTEAEATDTLGLTSFDADGFSIGSRHEINNSGDTFVSWCWKAGGSPTADNSNTSGAMTANSVSLNGTLQSNYTPAGSPTIYPKRMSINTDAGFSIVKYVGNGSITGSTIPHGLSNAPELVIIKNTNTATLSTNSWGVYHKSAGVGFLNLETTNAYNSIGNRWDSSHPTTYVVSLGGDSAYVHVENNVNYIAYCWHSVENYSKCGSYTGNGSADGPFVYCGFRPAFVMIKNISSVGNWIIHDTSRNDYNPSSKHLRGNNSTSEDPGANEYIDILSNGWKSRGAGDNVNLNSSTTYIYMAFAEQPFKYSNAR